MKLISLNFVRNVGLNNNRLSADVGLIITVISFKFLKIWTKTAHEVTRLTQAASCV